MNSVVQSPMNPPSAPEQNVKIYGYLFTIENALRELIIERLTAKAGSTWYKSRLPPDVYKKYRDGRKEDRKIPWKQSVPHHPIYYIDFPDLKKVLDNGTNWRDAFADLTARKDLMLATLGELEPIRNKVAHCRKTSSFDLQIVEEAFVKFEDTLSKSEVFRLLSRVTDAPELKRLLQNLREEAVRSTDRCRACKPLDDRPHWRAASQAWWFDESYFDRSLHAVETLFGCLEQYCALPRYRGTGHQIEKWVYSSGLMEHFAEADHVLRELIEAK